MMLAFDWQLLRTPTSPSAQEERKAKQITFHPNQLLQTHFITTIPNPNFQPQNIQTHPITCLLFLSIIIITYMPKQAKKQVKKAYPLQTTQQSNAYKQQVKKEGSVLLVGSGVQLQKLTQAETIPNYMSIYRKNYDGLKAVHQLDELQQNEYHYDQKAKRDRHFNIKKEGETKQTYQFPLTSNQEYGWRAPIDDLNGANYGVKQTFDEKLFMTLKSLKPAVKK